MDQSQYAQNPLSDISSSIEPNIVPFPQRPDPHIRNPDGSGSHPYSSSGFNILYFLSLVLLRPNPQINIGNVDLSCTFVVCDARAADEPIVYISESFAQMTGYTGHMILGRNCRFLQSPSGYIEKGGFRGRPDISEPAKVLLDRQGENGKEVQVQIVNFRRGGKVFRNLVTIVPIQIRPGGLYDDGLYDYLIGFQIDLDSSPSAVSSVDHHGNFSINYRHDLPIPRLFGGPPDFRPNQGLPVSDPPSKPTVVKDDVSALLQNFTTHLSDPSQTSETLSGYVWIRVLLEQCRHPVLVLSASGSVLYASPAASQLLKYPSTTSMVGLSLSRLCHRADIAAFARALRDANPMGVAATSSSNDGVEDEHFTTIDLVCRFRRRAPDCGQSPYIWTHSLGSIHSSVSGPNGGTGGRDGEGGASSTAGSRAGWARRYVILSIRPIRSLCLSRSQLAHSAFTSTSSALSASSCFLANPSRWLQAQHQFPQPPQHLLYPDTTEPVGRTTQNVTQVGGDPHTDSVGGLPLHPVPRSPSPQAQPECSSPLGSTPSADSFFGTLHAIPQSGISGLRKGTVASPMSIWLKISRTGVILFVPSNITLLLNTFAIHSDPNSQRHEYASLRRLMIGKSIHSLLRPINRINRLHLEKHGRSRHRTGEIPLQEQEQRLKEQNKELLQLIEEQENLKNGGPAAPESLLEQDDDPMKISNWTGRMNNNDSAITTALEAINKFKNPCLNPPIPCLIRHRWRRSVNLSQESAFDAEESDVLDENDEICELFTSSTTFASVPVALVSFFAGEDLGDAASDGGDSSDGYGKTSFLARIEVPTPDSLWAFLSDPPNPLLRMDVMGKNGLTVQIPTMTGGMVRSPEDYIMTDGISNGVSSASAVESARSSAFGQSRDSSIFSPSSAASSAFPHSSKSSFSPDGSSRMMNPASSGDDGGGKSSGGGAIVGPRSSDAPTFKPTDNIFAPEIAASNSASWQYEFGKLRMANEQLAKEAMMLRQKLALFRAARVVAAAGGGNVRTLLTTVDIQIANPTTHPVTEFDLVNMTASFGHSIA